MCYYSAMSFIKIIFYLFIFFFFGGSLYAESNFSCENYLITPNKGLNGSIVLSEGSPDIHLVFNDNDTITIFKPYLGQTFFPEPYKSGHLITGEGIGDQSWESQFLMTIEFNTKTNHLTFRYRDSFGDFNYMLRDGNTGSSNELFNYYRCKEL